MADLDEKQRNRLLDNFLSNVEFYEKGEFDRVKRVIASKYYNDFDIIERIGETEKSRTLLSSRDFLYKIIVEIQVEGFKFRNTNNKLEDFFLVFRFLNKHENKYYNNNVLISSLDFLINTLDLLDNDIIKKNKTEEKEQEINDVFEFFKRVIDKASIPKPQQTNYLNLFNKVKSLFQSDNYKYANTWLKFFVHFEGKNKFASSIESETLNATRAYIRTNQNAVDLRRAMSNFTDVKDFMTANPNFLNEVFSKSSNDSPFAIEFYQYFADDKKQQLLESWIPVNGNKLTTHLKEILDKINADIPDKLKLANKILSSSRTRNVQNEKEELFDLLNSLGLDEKELATTDYSNQVIDLICNTNISLHQSGIIELVKHKKLINSINLKQNAENFLGTCFRNVNAYHTQIKNILTHKIGIDKRFVDKLINSNATYKNQIQSFLVNKGDSGFYSILASKINGSTNKQICETFISVINNYQARYKDVLKAIYENRDKLNLDENIIFKLDEFSKNF